MSLHVYDECSVKLITDIKLSVILILIKIHYTDGLFLQVKLAYHASMVLFGLF